MTREEQNERVKRYRIRTNNAATKKYEKTKKGFLVRCYRNMKSRITGVQKAKHHLYKGKTLMDKQEFYFYSLNNKQFHSLFDTWENSNYDRKLTPSLDRVNSDLGYELSNVEWITHSENSRRGANSRFNKD